MHYDSSQNLNGVFYRLWRWIASFGGTGSSTLNCLMKAIMGFTFMLIATFSSGQNFPEFNLQSESSLASLKNDAHILDCANYILSHPVDPHDLIRHEAMGNTLFWMYNTPNYTFYIDETIAPLIKEDDEVLAIYMVAMAQFVLAYPEKAHSRDEVKLQAFTFLLAYCDNPLNNVKKSKAIAQAIFAMRNGSLKEYLKIT
jgi:hypothetical protein